LGAAAIILALIALRWAMVYGGLDAASTFDLFRLHKSLGFIAPALTVARLAARFAGASPRAPDSPSWERRVAALAQGLALRLDDLRRVGVAAAGADPIFNLFVIPNFAQPEPSLFAAAALAHKLAARGTALLIALHVTGALKHHFVDRDDVLRRMLPNWPKLGALQANLGPGPYSTSSTAAVRPDSRCASEAPMNRSRSYDRAAGLRGNARSADVHLIGFVRPISAKTMLNT
jgi:cytochrome b561